MMWNDEMPDDKIGRELNPACSWTGMLGVALSNLLWSTPMRTCLWIGCVAMATTVASGEEPGVQPFLHSGEFDKGEQSLMKFMETDPDNDQARFGLGVLQFFRGVERLGQSLHEFGVQGQGAGGMFVRLPVPENADPSPVSYRQFRRMLDDFRKDLVLAEATLALIKDEQVKLPLALADVHFDFDHDGKATDRFLDLLQFYNRRRPFDALKDNPRLLIAFDRGDVAWLRAYCHLLMGCLEAYLAVDNEAVFNWRSADLFAKPRHPFRGTDEEKWKAWRDATDAANVAEPLRWSRMRQHFLKAAALNKETWQHIRQETDNDSEWLPHAKQTSVIGLRVNDRMIDAWLELWDELEAIFAGKKTLPYFVSAGLGNKKPNVGVNLQRLFDDPPAKFRSFENLDERYFTNDPEADTGRLFRWFFTFGDSPIPMALWFN